MLPLIIDTDNVTIAAVGRGPALMRRLALIDAAAPGGRADDLAVFTDDNVEEVLARAGDRLRARLPDARDLTGTQVLFVAGLDSESSQRITAVARDIGALVNAEDIRPLCDFHVPATVRRGDLVFTVSTNGRSPGLARRLKRDLERRFGEEWAARLDELAAQRDAWRAKGIPFSALSKRTDDYIDAKGWLS